MNTIKTTALVLTTLITVVSSCVKDADVDIPGAKEQIVVEGFIEPGQPPIVILTRNKPYFGTNNFSSFQNLLVHNAAITVSDGTNIIQLMEVCSSLLPDSMLQVLSSITGLDSAKLKEIDFCVYSTFDPIMNGKHNASYYLNISAEGKNLSAVTTILNPVPLESIWYKDEPPYSDRGFIWARLDDPDTIGNAYRWFAMRKGIDNGFSAPLGSAFEDKFFNGQAFQFSYNRAHSTNDGDSNAGYHGFFKTGDTIIVKFCSIDQAHYQFWRKFETQAINYENPFAAPTSVNTNIKGGLGIWGGYGVSYDTTIAQ
jgi:hypothetical protein